MRSRVFFCLGAAGLIGFGLHGVPVMPLADAQGAPGTLATRVEAAGMDNVFKVTDRLYSGSSPDGDAGFASLAKLGIKTIISVDGAKPDLARAKKHGLRYVHLPIGYGQMSQEQAWRIARAVRDLPGPIYLHCHHGKHRGPAAAAAVMLCANAKCPAAAALAFMKQAGTDPRYAALYASVKTMKRPAKADLDNIPGDFPEVANISALALAMVEIDEQWDCLRLVKNAGWKPPPDHLDVDPPHVASILAQHFLEMAKTQAKRKELSQWLDDAGKNALEMEKLLRQVKSGARVEATALEKKFARMDMDCSRCHGKYRDGATAPR